MLYGTREGYTRRVAEYVAGSIQARGVVAEMVDAAHIPKGFHLDRYGAAVIAASVHAGAHEREIVRFVKSHVGTLNGMPTALLSVSLSQVHVENEEAPAERRAQAAADVKRMIDRLLEKTGWCPGSVKPVAGALLFSKYGFLTRLVMKHIARKADEKIDLSKDHEYTDWDALDDFTGEFVQRVSSAEIAVI
jgi:menaquinone-dependent protoporphyrinogen oxidase